MADRLLMGQYADGSYGMKLSVPGANVLSATGDQLIFDSKWLGGGTVHQAGTSTIGSTISFPSLSYRPMVIAIAYSGSTVVDPFWTSNSPDTRRWSTSYTSREASGPVFQVTTSSLYFVPVPASFTQHYTNVKYIIFRVTGS